MRDHKLVADFVRSVLDYDPDLGTFTWRERPNHPSKWNSRYAGKPAGSITNGYLVIRIDGISYQAACLAWAHHYGEWPTTQVDHENRNRSDNRLSNLRLATNAQNNANKGPQRNNTSGARGIYFEVRRRKWRARITVDGVCHDLGFFDTVETASAARDAAALRLLGDFATGARAPITTAKPRQKGKRSRGRPRVYEEGWYGAHKIRGKAERAANWHINKTSGVRGVSFDRRSGKWIAKFTRDGVNHYVRSYPTAEEAQAAWEAARNELD